MTRLLYLLCFVFVLNATSIAQVEFTEESEQIPVVGPHGVQLTTNYGAVAVNTIYDRARNIKWKWATGYGATLGYRRGNTTYYASYDVYEYVPDNAVNGRPFRFEHYELGLQGLIKDYGRFRPYGDVSLSYMHPIVSKSHYPGVLDDFGIGFGLGTDVYLTSKLALYAKTKISFGFAQAIIHDKSDEDEPWWVIGDEEEEEEESSDFKGIFTFRTVFGLRFTF